MKIKIMICVLILMNLNISAQEIKTDKNPNNGGWVSVGARSTVSLFDSDGVGLGTGGQFRIQMSNRVNSDWFADYISINVNDKVRSDYYHIGWSVLYYPFEQMHYPKTIQPYIIAGHCFDYNKKTAINDPSITKDRWGSAVQAGLGTHFNLNDRFDISFTCQYMIHLTKELEANTNGNTVEIVQQKNTSLEGHLLTTISLNYKLFKLWNN
jgi:hypothetical protein